MLSLLQQLEYTALHCNLMWGTASDSVKVVVLTLTVCCQTKHISVKSSMQVLAMYDSCPYKSAYSHAVVIFLIMLRPLQ